MTTAIADAASRALATIGRPRCSGCGSTMSDEEVIARRRDGAPFLSCCPERRLVAPIEPSRPISSELAPALNAARALARGPISYTTAGGDLVTVARDPIVASPAARAEAAGRALAIERLLEPASPDIVRRWLLSLAGLVERTPAADELDAKVRALCGALELPPCCYTAESIRAAGRALKWFPGLATLVETLEPFAAPLRAERAALEAVAAAPPPAQAREPTRRPILDPVDPERAQAAAQARRAELEERDPPRRPRPSHLSPELLAAERERLSRARGGAA